MTSLTMKIQETLKAQDARITWYTTRIERIENQLQNLDKLDPLLERLQTAYTRFDERLDALEEAQKNTDADIAKLYELVNKQAADTEDKSSPENDELYLNAMHILRYCSVPDKDDVDTVRAAVKKYPKEIAHTKEFTRWCVKWGKEIFEILGE